MGYDVTNIFYVSHDYFSIGEDFKVHGKGGGNMDFSCIRHDSTYHEIGVIEEC